MSFRSRATLILTIGLIFSSILTAGGIKGTVKYKGKVPRMKPIKMILIHPKKTQKYWMKLKEKQT